MYEMSAERGEPNGELILCEPLALIGLSGAISSACRTCRMVRQRCDNATDATGVRHAE